MMIKEDYVTELFDFMKSQYSNFFCNLLKIMLTIEQ